MKQVSIVILALLPILFSGCSKEDEAQTTIFEGAVLLTGDDQTFDDLRVVLYGHRNCEILGCELIVKRTSIIGSQGTFSIQDTSSEDRYYSIEVWGEGRTGIMKDCTPECNRLNPGKTYANLTIYVDR
ncbi:MAG: hypothetical protein WBN13_07850 [Robiginitalea sp.]|uniref:hypothetical protein n=1 Tax=Robiginitalea sp. TaxID=1902411 RepID=UPI003C72AB9F